MAKRIDPNVRLKRWRIEQGLSQREVANLLECSRATVAMMESGRTAITHTNGRKLHRVTGLESERYWITQKGRVN